MKGSAAVCRSFLSDPKCQRQTDPNARTNTASVLGWDGASDEWWAPTDAPAGPLPGETTPPPPWSPRAAPSPVGPLRFEYGGTKFNNHPAAQGATYYPAVVLPIIAVLRHGAAAAGLSLAFDTDDDTTYAALNVSSAAVSDAGGADVPVWEAGSAPGGGGVAFAFERRLLSAGGNARALRLGGELFAHDDCWRPALGRFWARHAEHAEPHPAAMGAALRAEGAATYAYFFGQPLPEPRAAYQQRDLSLNWDAAFPWVYHGVWLPGVGGEPDARYFPTITLPDGSAAVLNCDPAGHGGHAISSRHHDWQRCVNSSAAQLDAWYCALEEATGAASMVYGTLDEFGYNINPNTSAPLPECESGAYEDRLTCGANRLLRDRFPGAQVLDALNGSAPVVGAWTAAIVDVADEGYRALQLENARAVVAKTPSAVGVCLDRGDFVGLLNARGDDGVSMAPPPAANTSGGGKGAAPAALSSGIPARALVRSFRSVAPEIAAVLHSAGMALFLNADMGHRVDMYASVDGIFDEIGDDPRYRTASAWLASGGLPAAMWCHDKPAPIDGWTDCAALMANGTDADRDAFLQSHLLLGVHPSVPFPDNDHQQLYVCERVTRARAAANRLGGTFPPGRAPARRDADTTCLPAPLSLPLSAASCSVPTRVPTRCTRSTARSFRRCTTSAGPPRRTPCSWWATAAVRARATPHAQTSSSGVRGEAGGMHWRWALPPRRSRRCACGCGAC